MLNGDTNILKYCKLLSSLNLMYLIVQIHSQVLILLKISDKNRTETLLFYAVSR
jgi:hypothetical protein